MKKNTLDAFNESVCNSKKIKSLILNNMSSKEKEVIRLNLVYLTYNFLSNSILIEYYVDDEEYPNVEVSFTEVTNILDM